MVFMYGIPLEKSVLAVYGTLICIGIDLLILDFVIALLGKSEGLRNCLSIRGFYFDYDFQIDWNKHIDDL